MMESFDTKHTQINDKRVIERAREGIGKKDGNTRREFIKKLGTLIVALGAVTSGGDANKFTSIVSKHTNRSENENYSKDTDTTDKEIEELKQKLREDNREQGEGLEKYTFLSYKENKNSVETGVLAGNRFSDLYAMYLGTPEKSIVPEKLDIDFKANLARLWRMKFKFDNPNRTSEQEKTFREKFLREHKDLMDLAEHLYSSYNPQSSKKVSLEDYAKEIVHAIEDVHGAFMHAMYKLRNDIKFPHSRRALIEKMTSRISSRKLIACSLTELMPSSDGETNAQVLDFILRNAGVDFINAIPSVHDMLASFGPYQLTPALFAQGGVGYLAEKIERHLPKGTLPKSIEEVSGTMHHKVAYFIAIEHVAQLSGKLSHKNLVRVGDRIAKTSPKTLHKEILTFIATSHHLPEQSYKYFEDVFMRSPHIHAQAFEKTIRNIHNRGLRKYAHKALSNYDFLVTPKALTSV